MTVHKTRYGAFHTKLDGFLLAHGEFIMSMDDDDYFEDDYYKEMVEAMEYHRKVAKDIDKFDFFINSHNKYHNYLSGSRMRSIDMMIRHFHNHVMFAFRKSLLLNVKYPSYNVTIVRDDVPLMVPLYLQTNFNRIAFLDNKSQYRVTLYCKNVTHEQQSREPSKRMEYQRNGRDFLLDWIKKINQTQYEKSIRNVYYYLNGY